MSRRSGALHFGSIGAFGAGLDTPKDIPKELPKDPPPKRRRYNLTTAFDVLVGREPAQQRFTVYHELLTQRSEFFNAARSARWTDSEKPTILQDHEPEVFSAYLHCIYFGAAGLPMDFTPLVSDKSDQTKVGPEMASDTLGANTFKKKLLISLYLLADQLIDPVTANLAIDELIALVSSSRLNFGLDEVNLVYSSTTSGCTLRTYIRDWFVHEASPTVNNILQSSDYPYELLREIVLEMRTKNVFERKKSIEQAYDIQAISQHKGRYHQKTEKISPPKTTVGSAEAHEESSK